MGSPMSNAPFHASDVVLHEKFGRGVVLSVSEQTLEPNGDWGVTVAFPGHGDKEVVDSFLKLEQQVHRITKPQKAASLYGRATIETYQLLTAFGRGLLAALCQYLHREKRVVFGVPPHGDWEQGTDYRDAAFSTFGSGLLMLDPIDLGIAIRIENMNDDGDFWMRLAITLQRIGDKIHISIGDRLEKTIPANYQTSLADVCEDIFALAKKQLTEAVELGQSGHYGQVNPIGFIWKKKP